MYIVFVPCRGHDILSRHAGSSRLRWPDGRHYRGQWSRNSLHGSGDMRPGHWKKTWAPVISGLALSFGGFWLIYGEDLEEFKKKWLRHLDQRCSGGGWNMMEHDMWICSKISGSLTRRDQGEMLEVRMVYGKGICGYKGFNIIYSCCLPWWLLV